MEKKCGFVRYKTNGYIFPHLGEFKASNVANFYLSCCPSNKNMNVRPTAAVSKLLPTFHHKAALYGPGRVNLEI
jgi:hypothetical protein